MQIDNEFQGYAHNLLTKRKLWNENILFGLIPISKKCPACNKNFSLNENNSMVNRYLGICCKIFS
jgi:hypothetical protein